MAHDKSSAPRPPHGTPAAHAAPAHGAPGHAVAHGETIVGTHEHHVRETPPMHDPVDPWHDHAADERPQEAHAEVQNTPMIVGVGVALFFVVVASVAVVYGFYVHYTTAQLKAMERTTEHSPAYVTRSEVNESLRQVQAGGTLALKDADGKDRPVRLAPIEQARGNVAGAYAAGNAAPARGGASGGRGAGTNSDQ